MAADVFTRYRDARRNVTDAKQRLAEIAVTVRDAAAEIASLAGRRHAATIPTKTSRGIAAAAELEAAIRDYHLALRRLHRLHQMHEREWRERATQ